MPVHITEAVFPRDTAALQAVIREYVAWLDMDLSCRGFEQEMARFEQIFTLPSGLFLLARSEAVIAGCVGLLRHDDRSAEVKRLYVRPGFRGQRRGRRLLEQRIERARGLGFERLILDAVPQTVVAQGVYEAMGFERTEAYYQAPSPGTKFYEFKLSAETTP